MKILYVSRHFSKSGYYILEQLIRDKFDIVGVLFREDFDVYRHSLLRPIIILVYYLKCLYYHCEPCKFLHSEELLARKYGIRIIKNNDIKSDKFFKKIKELGPDIIVVGGGWPQLIPEWVFNFPHYGTLNTHPSLLPLFRGTSVHRWQILHGVRKSGATIHYVDAGFDTGNILAQAEVQIGQDDTPQTLFFKSAKVSAPLMSQLLRSIAALPKGGRLETLSQDEEEVHYFHRWEWGDERLRIDWSESFENLYNLIRASHQESYEYKGPIWDIQGKRFFIRRATLHSGNESAIPVMPDDDKVRIFRVDRLGVWLGRRNERCVLVIEQVQRYNKWYRWYRGYEAVKLIKQSLISVGDILQ